MAKDEIVVIDAVAEVVKEETTALALPQAPVRAEKLRVVELIPVDYIWVEEKNGFYPVFGAPYAGKPIENVEPRPRSLPQPRKPLPKG